MTTLSKRQTHGGLRTEYSDPETGELLQTYAPGDGSLRFAWCDYKRDATGRTVTMEEAAQVACSGFHLEADSSGSPQLLSGTALDVHRALLD